jgi:hypothetical protein
VPVAEYAAVVAADAARLDLQDGVAGTAAMLLTLKMTYSNAEKIRDTVRNLVLSIIVLDSLFITAFAGLPYGLATLAIIILPIVLARRMYVT